MIWATVSSQSCFCWLYRASPSLAAKNIINLISVSTIWWRPCVESSLMLLEEGVCYDRCILLAKLCQPYPASFCTPRPNLPVTPGISWLSTFHSSPLWWKGRLFFFGTHTHTFKACIKGKTKATQVRSISRTQRRCDAAELGVRQAASLGSDRHPPDSVPPPSRIHPLRTRVWLSKHRLSPYGCCSVAKSCLTLQVSPRWSLL